MRKIALQIALVAALIVVAIALRGRTRLPETPEGAVNALFDAAERGDDRAYLNLLAGPLRTSLEATRAEVGTERFRKDLRASAENIKGLAVSPAAGAVADQVALDVDLVFADRTERQRFLLVPQGNGWAITSMSAAVAETPKIPYGTPVFEE